MGVVQRLSGGDGPRIQGGWRQVGLVNHPWRAKQRRWRKWECSEGSQPGFAMEIISVVVNAACQRDA